MRSTAMTTFREALNEGYPFGRAVARTGFMSRAKAGFTLSPRADEAQGALDTNPTGGRTCGEAIHPFEE